MNLKKIKCVIVDFDETLYSNGVWIDEAEFFAKYLDDRNLLPEVVGWKEKTKYLQKKYPTYHIIKQIFAYLHENGVDDSDFRKFKHDNICEIRGEDTVFIKPQIIKELAKFYPVYILSDSDIPYIEFYLKEAGIDKKFFAGIYANTYDDEGYTKIPVMRRVLDETGLKPEEIIMIGDSQNSDIRPAKLVGFQTKHVKSVYETEELLQEFINLKSSKKI